MRKLTTLILAFVLVFALSGVGNAWYLDFEWGLGHDGEAVASGVEGVEFTTTDGYDWIYGDATTGNWNVTNNLGDSWGTGAYYMEGYVFTFLGTTQGTGRIDFTNHDGSYFSLGYCSASDFYVEAYDEFNNLLDMQVGAANVNVGMDYLTVASADANIAYIMVHDTGNYWCVDNMSGDATGVIPPNVPEPTTMVLLGLGLVGLGARLRKRS